MFPLSKFRTHCKKLPTTVKKLEGRQNQGHLTKEVISNIGKRGIWIDVTLIPPLKDDSPVVYRALVDTGSNWNILPHNFFKNELVWSEREIPDELCLIGVSGSKLDGKMLAQFTLQFSSFCAKTEFFVSGKEVALSYPIIGLTLLSHLNAEIFCKSKTINISMGNIRETINYFSHKLEI